MSSDIYEVNSGNLSAVGSSLTTIADTISGDRKYGALAGADDYGDLTNSVGDFDTKWDNGLFRMVQSCHDLGAAATKAAELYSQTEDVLVSGWGGSSVSTNGQKPR